jgi:hypothetical protein
MTKGEIGNKKILTEEKDSETKDELSLCVAIHKHVDNKQK